MKNTRLTIDVQSEIGSLNAVLLHTPGAEVENMTPRMAQRALYSDILNLSIARKEYEQIEGVLSKVAKVYQVRDLLARVLDQQEARRELISRICIAEQAGSCFDTLMAMPTPKLVTALIEVRATPQRGDGFDRIAERVYQFEEVESMYLMSGAYDFVVTITGRTLKEVATFVSARLSTIEGVTGTATHFILKKYKEKGVTFETQPVQEERMKYV